MKVFVYSSRPYDRTELQRAASEKHELLFTEKRLMDETAHYSHGCPAVSLFTSDDASAPVLAKLHACGVQFLALRSVGCDHVDLRKAASLGMKVVNVPDYSPYAVAEHAVALLLALNRKIVEGQMLMQLQDFRIDTLKGYDIHGKTVGIIGTGKIGMAFAHIMKGFGAKLLAFDPIENPEAASIGMRYDSLEGVLRESDIVSLHCPLIPATRHLISDTQFQWMKKNAILINTSRGAVVNTNDLIEAIESGRLGGACLDVYENEKGLFFTDHRNDILHDQMFCRLRSFKNVIITAHQAFLTQDAIESIAATTIANLDALERGVPCDNELNVIQRHEDVVKR
ncbi:MAG TPA: 2-hydroxyacid dehydrogenase [Chryseosolibacter sp.]